VRNAKTKGERREEGKKLKKKKIGKRERKSKNGDDTFLIFAECADAR
jgi:hypothetical protein